MQTFLDASPIEKIELLSIQGEYEKESDSLCFILVLNGELDVYAAGNVGRLNTGDVYMARPTEALTVKASGTNLVLLVLLHESFFRLGQSRFEGTYICDSSQDYDRDYSTMRNLLAQLALEHFGDTDIHNLRELSLVFSLLYYLNRYHFVPGAKASGKSGTSRLWERELQIRNYLEANYQNPVTLQELAEQLYLHPTYLSRFIKKQLGTGFSSYLNQIRLRHAVRDLVGTSLAITVIAVNNGFPSANSFSKLFRSHYGMTPNAYRKSHAAPPAQVQAGPAFDDETRRLAEAHLRQYADIKRDTTGVTYPAQSKFVVNNMNVYQETRPIWHSMINIGVSSNLDNYNLRSHLALAQKEIGFTYGRIQSVLNEESIPSIPGGGYNYSNFDNYIEMLLSINIVPFLDITTRTNYIFLASSNLVYPAVKEGVNTTNEQRYLEKLSALIKHCINTFGAEEVERWGFEISYFHDELLQPTETTKGFVSRIAKGYKLIKTLLPRALVGGLHHNVSVSPHIFSNIIAEMDRLGFTPDFISLSVFPIEPFSDEIQKPWFVLSSNPNFPLDRVTQVKEILKQYPKITQALYVTVLGPDVRVRNYINDSCFKGTFFVKNTIDLIGQVDGIGYWQLSDIGSEHTDASRLLFGASGIITKQGIPKAGFTALRMFNDLSSFVIQKGPCYIVTTNSFNTYHVLLFNYVHYSEEFSLRADIGIPPEDIYAIFGNPATRDISLTLKNLNTGRYRVTNITLNREYGSLLDDWLHYGILDNLSVNDVKYFREIVRPQRLARFVNCGKGELEMHVQLLPHEVKLIEIAREL